METNFMQILPENMDMGKRSLGRRKVYRRPLIHSEERKVQKEQGQQI